MPGEKSIISEETIITTPNKETTGKQEKELLFEIQAEIENLEDKLHPLLEKRENIIDQLEKEGRVFRFYDDGGRDNDDKNIFLTENQLKVLSEDDFRTYMHLKAKLDTEKALATLALFKEEHERIRYFPDDPLYGKTYDEVLERKRQARVDQYKFAKELDLFQKRTVGQVRETLEQAGFRRFCTLSEPDDEQVSIWIK